MGSLIFGLVVLALGLLALNAFTKVNPHKAATVLKAGGGLGALALAKPVARSASRSTGRAPLEGPTRLGACCSRKGVPMLAKENVSCPTSVLEMR